MQTTQLFSEIDEHITHANYFQTKKEYGRARVSARLAAGKAAKYFLSLHYSHSTNLITPYQALENLKSLQKISPSIRLALDLLTQKVNQDYSFPMQAEFINSANEIINYIKNEVTK